MKFKIKDYVLIFLTFITIGLGLFLRNEIRKNENLSIEKAKIENNLKASNDSIITYRNSNGKLISEKGTFQYTIEELNKENRNLYSQWLDLKNKPPKTVTVIEYQIVESYKDFPSVINTTNTTGNIILTIDTNFDDYNSRNISVNIPWSISYYKDGKLITLDQSNSIAKLKTGIANIDLKQNITIKSAIVYDKNEDRWKTVFTTDYPGLNLTQLSSTYIEDNMISDKVRMSMRREYGVGIHLGTGIGYNPTSGPIFPNFYIGIGLNYTPKKLQFK